MANNHDTQYNLVTEQLIAAGFLTPRPRMMSFRAWSMLIPAALQVLGLCLFGVVAWSLTEMTALSDAYRVALVVAGSFAIAIGGDVGSLPVTVEVFRKGLPGWVDWLTLIVSGAASLAETVIALSFLGGFEIIESVPRIVALAVLATLDSCLGMAELGDYLRGHDERMEQWHRDFRRAVKQFYRAETTAQSAEEAPVGYVARSDDRILPVAVDTSGNGHRSYMDFERAVVSGELSIDALTGAQVAAWAHRSSATGRRWLRQCRSVAQPVAEIAQGNGGSE